MLGGARSVLGLIGLVGGAAAVVIGLVSFLGEGSWHDFLFRVGIAYLVIAAATLVYLLDLRAKLPALEAELESATEWLWAAVAGTGLFGGIAVLIAAITRGISLHAMIELIGAVALWMFVGAIGEGWKEIVTFIRESSKPSRPCPRCGHSVRAGVMKCPSCEFDFSSVGREAS